MNNSDNLFFYVGTYAKATEESIFLFQLNRCSGELKLIKGFKPGENPSYLSFNHKDHQLFAVNEYEQFNEDGHGAVSSFQVNPENGFLDFQSRQSSEGALPVYAHCLQQQQLLLVANYHSGNASIFPFDTQGLASGTALPPFKGSGPDQTRQEQAHTHQLIPDPHGNFIFAIDLGIDKILSFTVKNKKLVPAIHPVAFKTHAGWGPRQLVFHPNGKQAYLIHELESRVSSLTYNNKVGTFSELATLPTIPISFRNKNKRGGVSVHPNGKFLYVSNRGHDSLSVYTLSSSGKTMEFLENISCGGEWPRDFTIDPSGRFLIVANQKSNEIISFALNQEDGTLKETGFIANVPNPAFAGFWHGVFYTLNRI